MRPSPFWSAGNQRTVKLAKIAGTAPFPQQDQTRFRIVHPVWLLSPGALLLWRRVIVWPALLFCRIERAAFAYCAGAVVDGCVVEGCVDGAVVVGSVVEGVVVDGCVVVEGCVVDGSVVEGFDVVGVVEVAGSVVVTGGVAVFVVASFFGIRRTTRTMTTAAATIAIIAFRLMFNSSWRHPTRKL